MWCKSRAGAQLGSPQALAWRLCDGPMESKMHALV